MIKVENVNKSYGDVKALKDIAFNVSKGELFGFIGPDGAGKTSLLRIITTLLLADDGSAKVNGYDVVKDYLKIRKIVGYMPGRFSLYQDLTVLENLEFFATVFGTSIDENYDLIKDIYSQIEPFKHRRAGKLSGGMKQKLALSCALIHKPKVLVLDEPTTGVDAVSRKEFWEMLKNIQKKDISILVSTPYMDEASLCDRVALIQKGELMSIETPQNIIKLFNKNLLAVRADNMYKLLLDLRDFEYTDSVFLFGQYMHLTMKNKLSDKELLNNYLISKNYSNVEIVDIEPNIEDCFMDLMVEN
jgi:ABC-type multidrug transport system ATPase subunit